MKAISRLVAASTILAVWPAIAFEVDGFRTGMTVDDVKTIAEKMGSFQALDDNTYVVNTNAGTYTSFNFCKSRLVSLQQGHPATLKHLSLLIADFNKRYGQPFSVQSGSRPDPSGEIYEMGMWWHAGAEFVSVYYMSAAGDSLSTSHQARNACFKVPR